MKRQKIVLERLGDASFLLSLIPFLKGNKLRNSISFGEPKLYVIQLRLGVCVLHTRVKRKQTKKTSQEKRRHSTKQQQSVNIMRCLFKKATDILHGPSLLFQERETKLNLQNFLQDHVFLPSGSSTSISLTPLCCWLNTSECCGIDPVIYPFYYLFSHPKAAFRFDSTTVVEKHKFSSPFAVRGQINGCEIKP